LSTTSRPLHQVAPDKDELALFFLMRTQNPEDEEQLFRISKDLQQQLSEQISGIVTVHLGPKFRFQGIDIQRGSVEIWVYLLRAYTAISQYGDFLASLEKIQVQVRDCFKSSS
jgi:hypothetical protein